MSNSEFDEYVRRLATEIELGNVDDIPQPSNNREVGECHRALLERLERHPADRDLILHRIAALPSDSRWANTLLDWAKGEGELDQVITGLCIRDIANSAAPVEAWFDALGESISTRLLTVLKSFASTDPDGFFNHCERLISHTTSARLATAILLFSIASSVDASEFCLSALHHPVFDGILKSLLYDTSNALFAVMVRLLTVVVPHDLTYVTTRVPLIMVVLGRAVSWRDRPFLNEHSSEGEATTWTPKPIVTAKWTVATSDQTLTLPASSQPHPVVRLFLATIYNAWPSNILAFVRDPVSYLQGKEIASVYDIPWSDVWRERSLATKAGPLLCNFHLHPSMVQHTSSAELLDRSRWDRIDPLEFTAKAHALAHAELLGQTPSMPPARTNAEESLRDMVAAETTDLGRLCMELALLRGEQSYSQELQKEYLAHIGRLHQETLRFDSDEAEINGLASRLKEQNKIIDNLTKEMQLQRASATKAQQKHIKWQDQLRDRLSALREERKTGHSESVQRSSDLAEALAVVKRQRDELAREKNARSKIENESLEMKPKVARIGDYETRITQLTDSQRLWDYDVRKRHEAEGNAEMWRARCIQLQESLDSSAEDLTTQASAIQQMERRLAATHVDGAPETQSARRNSTYSGAPYKEIAETATQKIEVLQRDISELQAECEDLRQQVTDKAVSYDADKARRTAFLWA